jgi:hypothetical protein
LIGMGCILAHVVQQGRERPDVLQGIRKRSHHIQGYWIDVPLKDATPTDPRLLPMHTLYKL